MTRAVIYARYSSDTQTEQSIEGQVRVCTEYALRNNLAIVETYADRAISGKTDNRPEFRRMIKDGCQRKFDAVIVYRTDRFARNKYDSAIYKAQLRKAGVAIHYAAEAIPEGPEGVILESLMEGLAEYYSLELSQKVRRGMHENARKGKCTGGNLALGYKISSDKSFEIDEVEAGIVRQIFNMFVSGSSQADIIRHMNNAGVQTSRKIAFNRSSLRTVLKNEKYIGVYCCGDIRIDGGVPAIVDKDIFDAAQARLAEKAAVSKRPIAKLDYLLTGKLFCGYCDSPMTGVSGTSSKSTVYGYYYCANQRHKKGCQKKCVGKNKIENLVVETTRDYVLQPEIIVHIAKRCHELDVERTRDDTDLQFARKRLDSCRRAVANIVRAIEEQPGTNALPARLKELERELREAERTYQALAEARKPLSAEQIEALLRNYAGGDSEDEQYRKNIIECFVTRALLFEDKLVLLFNIISDGQNLDVHELLLKAEGELPIVESSPTRTVGGGQETLVELHYVSGLVVLIRHCPRRSTETKKLPAQGREFLQDRARAAV